MEVEIFAKPDLVSQAFIETPCEVSWDKMTGNDSVRFCSQCSLNVYNIANLTDKEAQAVFAKGKAAGRVCARLYRRPDGTIMTDNCPRALRKIRDGSRWLKTKIVASITLVFSLFAPAPSNASDAENKGNAKTPAHPSFKLGKVASPASNFAGDSTPAAAPGSVEDARTGMAGGISFKPPDMNQYKFEVSNFLAKAWKADNIAAPFPKVEFKIDASGKTSAAKIVISSGSKEKDSKALKAISKATFVTPPSGAQFPYSVTIGGKEMCDQAK